MAKRIKKPGIISSQSESVNGDTSILDYVILFILDVVFLFSHRIPMNFWRWLITMGVRFYIFSWYSNYHFILLKYFAPAPGFSLGEIIHNVLGIGYVLFCLWYFFTTLILFLAAFSYRFGYGNSNSDEVGESFGEINNFKGYIDTQLKSRGYSEGMDWLRGRNEKR
jgi:hypothetical protein